MRRSIQALLALVVAGAGVAADADSPAAALSCDVWTAEQAIEQDPIVFIGEQVDESADTTDQFFRVDRWIRGGSGDGIVMQRSLDWGSSYLDAGIRLFRGWPNDDGVVETALCGNAYPLLVALTILDGPPQPLHGGEAAFVVAMDEIPGMEAAVLNADAQVIRYVEGDRTIHEFAPCPDHNVIATVSSTRRDTYGSLPEGADWNIELRTATLEVLDRHAIAGAGGTGEGAPGLRDLECHAADGSVITALAPKWRNDPLAARLVPFGGAAIQIEGGEVRQHAIEWPRDATLDRTTGALHVLNGEEGRILTTIADGVASERALPGTHVGWHVSVDDDRFEIVSEDISVDPSNRHAGIVSHVLRGEFDKLESTPLPIETIYASFAGVVDTPDGRMFHIVDQDDAILVPAGDPTTRIEVPIRWHQTAGYGESTTLVSGADVESGIAILDLETGATEAIDGLIYARVVAAITPTVAVTFDNPSPTTITHPPETTAAPSTSTPPSASIGPDERLELSAPPGPARPADDDGDARPLIALVTLLVAGGAVSLLAVRRRRAA